MLNGGNAVRRMNRLTRQNTAANALTLETLRGSNQHIKALINRGGRGVVLDRLNEILSAAGLTLHPTKGYRVFSVKGSKIATITNAIRTGQRGVYSTAQIRFALNAA